MSAPEPLPEERPAPDPLAVLAEVSQEFAATLDLDRTIEKALELITRSVGAEGGALFLLDAARRELRCQACVGPAHITGMRLSASQGIVGRCIRENTAQLVRDVSRDPDFLSAIDQQSGFVTRSVLCAPLSARCDPIGVISLVNKVGSDARFGDRDRLLLQTLASSVALAILNARLAADLVGQERVRRELELAAEIQRNLLPAPRPAPFPVLGANVPAREVSGDFYDFFELPDGRIAFGVGDVAGKGMNAALLMAKTASLFRALGKRSPEPGRLLALLNAELCETAARGLFVTMVAGLHDPGTGTVRLANAGHEPPLLRAASGAVSTIPAEAPPLGIVPGIAFGEVVPESSFALEGGALYVFTDGFTEARDPSGNQLGVGGLRVLLDAASDLAPDARLARILDEVRRLDTRDDLTLLLIDAGCARDLAREAPALSLRFASRPGELKRVREAVEQAARELGIPPAITRDVVLAVDEACQNVIRHAYGSSPDGEAVLEMGREKCDLVVTLRDFAAAVDPERVRPRPLEDLRPGGLGTHLMRAVMDTVEFRPPASGPGNVLRMTKRIG